MAIVPGRAARDGAVRQGPRDPGTRRRGARERAVRRVRRASDGPPVRPRGGYGEALCRALRPSRLRLHRGPDRLRWTSTWRWLAPPPSRTPWSTPSRRPGSVLDVGVAVASEVEIVAEARAVAGALHTISVRRVALRTQGLDALVGVRALDGSYRRPVPERAGREVFSQSLTRPGARGREVTPAVLVRRGAAHRPDPRTRTRVAIRRCCGCTPPIRAGSVESSPSQHVASRSNGRRGEDGRSKRRASARRPSRSSAWSSGTSGPWR